MKKLSLIVALFLLTSLSVYSQLNLYAPRPLVIPAHTARNQLYASGGYSFSRDHGSADINLSYSLINGFATFASVTYNPFTYRYDGPESFLRPNYHYKYNNLSSSFGFEYFKSGFKGIISVFEVQTGFGFSSHDRYSYAMQEVLFDKKTEYSYSRIFTQVSATKIFNHFDVSVALRATNANFGEYREFEINGSDLYIDNDIPSRLFIEPTIAASYIYKGIKLNLQTGLYSSKVTSSDGDVEATSTERVFFGRIALQYSLK